MKTKLSLILLFITFLLQAQTVKISASETDAAIVINGQQVGTGNYKLKLDSKECYTVKVEKPGFLKYTSTVCGKRQDRNRQRICILK